MRCARKEAAKGVCNQMWDMLLFRHTKRAAGILMGRKGLARNEMAMCLPKGKAL